VTLRFLTDEDFHGPILNGLLRLVPQADIVRAQDVGLAGEPDPVVLAWAEQHGRIIVTHDATTMPAHAHERLRAGLTVVGVCVVHQSMPVGEAIQELLIAVLCSREDDWLNQVRYIPL
jgi:hypothetical protein